MSLELVLGPMFSGKTSQLIARLTVYADLGFKVLYVNSNEDTRNTYFSTHSGTELKTSSSIKMVKCTSLSSLDISKYSVIGIDESQFFDDLVIYVKEWLDLSKHVISVGLDGDINRKPMGKILDLIPYADTVTKITAKCMICIKSGELKPAPFTIRKDGQIKDREIGGSDIYIAVCRKHILDRS